MNLGCSQLRFSSRSSLVMVGKNCLASKNGPSCSTMRWIVVLPISILAGKMASVFVSIKGYEIGAWTVQLCSAAPLKSVDHEMLAGHVYMRLDGQIAHDAGDVLGRTDPAQGNSGGQLRLPLAEQTAQEVGRDHARADRIDRHFRPELLCQRPGEAKNPGLAPRMGLLADSAGPPPRQRIDRGDRDDPPACILL